MVLAIAWHAQRALWRAPSRRRRGLHVETIVWHVRRWWAHAAAAAVGVVVAVAVVVAVVVTT